MPALPAAALADLVRRHFPAGAQVTAYAVARAESGGRPEAVGDGGASIGIWQIDRVFHPYSIAYLLNPENNATAAVAISGGGTNWNPWCSWERSACGGAGNGSYRAYLAEATAALAAPPAPGLPPPAQVNPGGIPWALGLAGAALLLYAVRGR